MLVTNLAELRKKSLPIESEEEMQKIYAELLKAYAEIKNPNKVGLAAPQIGILKQIALIEYQDKKLVLVNPVILERDNKVLFYECCLSIPGISVQTDRYDLISLENGFGEMRTSKIIEGYLAIVVQHETDHLNGLTILERKHRRR